MKVKLYVYADGDEDKIMPSVLDPQTGEVPVSSVTDDHMAMQWAEAYVRDAANVRSLDVIEIDMDGNHVRTVWSASKCSNCDDLHNRDVTQGIAAAREQIEATDDPEEKLYLACRVAFEQLLTIPEKANEPESTLASVWMASVGADVELNLIQHMKNMAEQETDRNGVRTASVGLSMIIQNCLLLGVLLAKLDPELIIRMADRLNVVESDTSPEKAFPLHLRILQRLIAEKSISL